MRTAARRIAIGAAALVVVVTACVDATRSTSTDPALYEGAPVSLAGELQVSANINGKLSTAVREWAIDGVIKNGVAEAERAPGTRVENMVMPALAISDKHPLARSRPYGSFATTAKDKNGTHDFVFRAGKAGGPASSIAVLDNGKLAQVFSYEWRRVRGGWVAKGFAVTIFKDGKAILTARSGPKLAPGTVAAAVAHDDPCMFDASVDCENSYGGELSGAGGGGTYGSPGTGSYYGCNCNVELATYLAAAWSVSMGTQLAIETALVVSPYTLAALGGAWVYVGFRLWVYNSCYRACYTTGSLRTTPTFLASVGPPRLATCSSENYS